MNILRSTPEIAKAISSGLVGILPTDTVYGLVASAKNRQAVAKINHLKQRLGKPGTVIAASINQLLDLGVKESDIKTAKKYWPGPVSVVVDCDQRLDYIHLDKEGIAVRIPGNKRLLNVLKLTGPLVTSSANISERPTAKSLKEAQDYFGEAVDFYVNGGTLRNCKPSTIVRVQDGELELIREGAVKI